MSRIQELESKIINDFLDRTLTRNYILEKYKISVRTLYKILESNNIPKRGKFRKHFFNEHYFDEINTPEKAQVLGFLYADGCVSKTGTISVNLKENDKEYLLTLLDKFKASTSILYYIKSRIHMGPNKVLITSAGQYGFSLCSKTLAKSCAKAGLVPRKSWANVCFPNESILPKELRRYFILGILEGDGTIYVSKHTVKTNGKYINRYISWLGSLKLIEGISDVIKEELGINSSLIKLKSKIITKISFKSKKNVKAIINWLYSGATFCLKRKFNAAQEILSLC